MNSEPKVNFSPLTMQRLEYKTVMADLFVSKSIDTLFKPTHRNTKTGLLYQILCIGQDVDNKERLIVTYRSARGRISNRSADIFFGTREDGILNYEPYIEVPCKDHG